MSDRECPTEGSIFVLSYTECDYDNQSTTALVYVLKAGRLEPLLGVMDLPDGACFNLHDSYWYDRALKVVQAQQVTEVYAPQFIVPKVDFFGQTLGFTELTEALNEQGEIECWFEIGDFLHNWEFIQLLENLQIKVVEINPETLQIVT